MSEFKNHFDQRKRENSIQKLSSQIFGKFKRMRLIIYFSFERFSVFFLLENFFRIFFYIVFLEKIRKFLLKKKISSKKFLKSVNQKSWTNPKGSEPRFHQNLQKDINGRNRNFPWLSSPKISQSIYPDFSFKKFFGMRIYKKIWERKWSQLRWLGTKNNIQHYFLSL